LIDYWAALSVIFSSVLGTVYAIYMDMDGYWYFWAVIDISRSYKLHKEFLLQ